QMPERIDILGPGGLMDAMPGRHMDHTVQSREPTPEPVAIQDRSCHIDPAGIRGRHNVQPQGGIAARLQQGGQDGAQIARASCQQHLHAVAPWLELCELSALRADYSSCSTYSM